MEDAHCIAARDGATGAARADIFAGVFDGHGGSLIAERLASRMPEIFFDAYELSGSAKEAIDATFAALERECTDDEAGSTALCVFVIGDWITVANCGDCRALLVLPSGEPIQLTRVHRVSDKSEKLRVRNAGAGVGSGYFTNGNLSLQPTRSFGDRDMRRVGLIATPDVRTHIIPSEGGHLIVATDGLYDVMDRAAIAACVKGIPSPQLVADGIIAAAVENRAMDNVTVVVVALAGSIPMKGGDAS